MRAPNHLNALRAFEAVARHLSYVRAAEELSVTPAAVGNLIRALEETLGVELFHRSPSGPARLEITAAARRALPDLQAGFDRLSLAFDRLRPGIERTPITVTVPPAFADKWLLNRVEHFQTRYPAFELHVDTNAKVVDFNVDQVDIGIRYGAGRWDGLKAIRLLTDEFFPVCSPALLTGSKPLRSADDLQHHPLIHDVSMRQENRFPTWRSWLAKAGIVGVDTERGLRINDSAAVIQAAISGGGVALGRTTLVADELKSGALVRPFGDSQSHEFAYYVIHKPDRSNDPSIKVFVDWVLTEAADYHKHGK